MGLTPVERRLAWAQNHLAANLGGSQQLRQTMGHRQFGARVVYGDCIFITISPNEQHSALVLRLSRFRRNDPYVQHGDGIFQRLACADFPRLEASNCHGCGKSHATTSKRREQEEQETVTVELPEYDLRRAATARDPLAVVEGYKIEILLRLAILLGVRMCPNCPR